MLQIFYYLKYCIISIVVFRNIFSVKIEYSKKEVKVEIEVQVEDVLKNSLLINTIKRMDNFFEKGLLKLGLVVRDEKIIEFTKKIL